MYTRKSRLSESKRHRLIEHFVAGTTARTAAERVGVHRNPAASFFTRLRKVIANERQEVSPIAGEVEVDESYLGGVRKGKRGRGGAGKVPVFGLLKRGGKVYTTMIPNARTATLRPMMERMIQPDSVVYTDRFSSDDALDVSRFHPVCSINHSERFVEERNHINDIRVVPVDNLLKNIMFHDIFKFYKLAESAINQFFALSRPRHVKMY